MTKADKSHHSCPNLQPEDIKTAHLIKRKFYKFVYWYNTTDLIDKWSLAHMIAGGLICFAIKSIPGTSSFSAVCLTTAIHVLWEIIEFQMWGYEGLKRKSWAMNTAGDLTWTLLVSLFIVL